MEAKFITIEGVAGAGKTTLIDSLKTELVQQLAEKVVFTREPGGSKVAEDIRQIVLNPDYANDIDNRTEALLFAASRRQHLVDIVLPALAENKIVISDRYIDSSIAYQGGGRGLGVESILEINRFAIDDTWPDLTLYLDLEPEIGLQRIQKRESDKNDRLDFDQLDFHQKVRKAYLEIAEQSDRFAVIDASQGPEEIKQAALSIIEAEINK